jgi:hypothetical protein
MVCEGCAGLLQARLPATRSCPLYSKPVSGAMRVFDAL